MVQAEHRHGSRGPALTALGLLALWCVLGPGPAVASEPVTSTARDGDAGAVRDRTERAGEGDRRLDPPAGPLGGVARRGDLERRVAFHLSSLGVMRQIASPLHPVQDHVMYQDLVAGVEHGAEKATRRALGEYLLESTNLAGVIDRIKNRSGDRAGTLADGADGPAAAGRGADFGVRFYRGLPLLEMRYDTSRADVRLKVSPKGAVGFDLSHPRTDRARLSIAFDGDDTVRVNCRLEM